MDKPTITIGEKSIEMLEPKAYMWRKGVKLSMERDKIPATDYVDRHCEFIAQAFGVTTEEVLENIDVADIMPTFYGALGYIMNRLWAKMLDDKKNKDTVESQI